MGPTATFPATAAITDAEQLLVENKLDGVFPVPLEAIARNLGYEALEFDPNQTPELRTIAGMVNHDAKKIFINREDNVYRQRFTLAHEIAHVVLHAGTSIIDYRKNIDQPSTQREHDANNFAANLLMPSIHFIRAWLVTGGDEEELSRKFGVSQEAIEIRAKVLKVDRA